MARTSPQEKLTTRINNILKINPELVFRNNKIYYESKLLISVFSNRIKYSKRRYYKSSEVKIKEDDYEIVIYLTNETVGLITSIKPKSVFAKLLSIFKAAAGESMSGLIIGSEHNRIRNGKVEITYQLLKDLMSINSEEITDSLIKIKNRIKPFLNNHYGLVLQVPEYNINWSLRLRELIESNEVSQSDIKELASQLKEGDDVEYVVKSQVNKQVSWLLESIENILEEENMSAVKAKQLGSSIFNYSQTSITGPEHLMEKILYDYGQHSLFGVPAIINTDKYVQNDNLPRVQFDLLLINSLGEVEVVELKRTDEILFKYDSNRNKFYASPSLSIAISQTERYLSTIIKDNDQEYLISGMTVKDYLNNELGSLINIETVRPTGLIIIGSSSTLAKDYEKLTASIQSKVSKEDYLLNLERSYRELKDSHKNIKIITYSDLLQSARMRLELS